MIKLIIVIAVLTISLIWTASTELSCSAIEAIRYMIKEIVKVTIRSLKRASQKNIMLFMDENFINFAKSAIHEYSLIDPNLTFVRGYNYEYNNVYLPVVMISIASKSDQAMLLAERAMKCLVRDYLCNNYFVNATTMVKQITLDGKDWIEVMYAYKEEHLKAVESIREYKEKMSRERIKEAKAAVKDEELDKELSKKK
jgi:hypothetical protein